MTRRIDNGGASGLVGEADVELSVEGGRRDRPERLSVTEHVT